MPIGDIGHYTDRTRHRVRLNDGRVVTRSEAENIYARSRGFRSQYERKRAYRGMKQARRYQRDQDDARTNFRRQGREFSKRDYDEARARLQADYARHGNSWRDIDKSPDGALAQYLVTQGKRSDTAQYAVGESPSII